MSGDYRPLRGRCQNRPCGVRLSADDTSAGRRLCPSCRRIFRIGRLLGFGLGAGVIALARFAWDAWIGGL